MDLDSALFIFRFDRLEKRMKPCSLYQLVISQPLGNDLS